MFYFGGLEGRHFEVSLQILGFLGAVLRFVDESDEEVEVGIAKKRIIIRASASAQP